jgi:hypothetical protein
VALGNLEGQWQNLAKFLLAKKLLDLSSDTLKMILCSSAIPTEDGAVVLGDVTQIVASGYTAGGEALAGKTVTQDDSANKAKFTADPVVWAALGSPSMTLVFAAIYAVGTYDGHVNPLIYVWREDTQPNGQSFTINPNANGFGSF